MNDLDGPFTDQEINGAIGNMAKNKASGPDGLTAEFIQKNLEALWPQIRQIVQDFHGNRLDLRVLNQANVVFIPKKVMLQEVSDFRPISIINIVPKLISKILATRLPLKMPELISPFQTAFIRGRQISENFNATRELLQHIDSIKRSAILAKFDFAKAFDSLEWPFLLRVLEARGFSTTWISWIEKLLVTASSRVLINEEASLFLTHHRGVRQGDPLSPLLFNLPVDVLQKMIEVANSTLRVPISDRIP